MTLRHDLTGEPLPRDHYQCCNCHGVFHDELGLGDWNDLDELEMLCDDCYDAYEKANELYQRQREQRSKRKSTPALSESND